MTWGSSKVWLTNLQRNKFIKSQNGNRTVNQVLKVYHWNKGNGWWESKINEIESLLLIKKPDLLFISEANMRMSISEDQKSLAGYTTIHPRTVEKLGCSRLILLIREEVEFQLQRNLMSDLEASIWVKVTIKGRRSLYIGGNYREHKLLMQQQPNVSGTPALQNKRKHLNVGQRQQRKVCTVL